MKTNKQTQNKKAQEEMVGFVVIVLLVIVIGLVFLGFSLRQTPKSVQHDEAVMQDTMYSMLAFSSCESNGQEMIKDCYNNPGKECDGKPVCDHVKELFIDILDKTQGTDISNAFVHGYVLNITNPESEPLIYAEKGELTGNYFASTIPLPDFGDISFNLRFYYSQEQTS